MLDCWGDCGEGGWFGRYLEAEDFRLSEGERFAVDFDETFAGLVVEC